MPRVKPAGGRCAATRRMALERLEDRALLAVGLTAQYFDDATLGSLKVTRVDAAIDFDWGAGSPAAAVAADTFSVRWTGRVRASHSEPYTFRTRADDGVRLWVNRRLIIDDWQDEAARTASGQIVLKAGEWYELTLEYYENSGHAAVQLWWSSTSRAEEIVPTAALDSTAPPDDRGSIRQEFWSGIAGSGVTSLVQSPLYPSRPSGREHLTSFESFAVDWADDYGARVRGYLTPAASGVYELAISGDESTRLYLDATGDTGTPALVAWSDAATGFREFTRFATQVSAPVALQAGRRYTIEALHKEAAGADHFSVAWRPAGEGAFSVIPADVLSPAGVDETLPAQGSILATLASGRPRLLSTPERFQWLKQQVATTGQLQTWYNAVRTGADAILGQPLPQYNPDVRGTILGVSKSVLDHVYRLALVYRIGGDARYAERAWQELATAAVFPDWHPAHFLDTAEMTHAFAIGYDWMYDYWTPARRATLSAAIVEKGLNAALPLYRGNAWWVVGTSNNWNTVCNGGIVLGALAIAEEQPALVEEILARALPSAAAVLQHFSADAGAWYEGPGYWDYTTAYHARLLAGLESTLGSDFGLGRIAGTSETGDFALYNTSPTRLSFNFADGGAGTMRGPQLFWYARRFNRPLLAWYERTNAPSTPNPLDLLWYDGRGSDAAAAVLPTDVHYRGDTAAYATQDVVTMRSSWTSTAATFVGFKAGKVGDSHGNLDAGSFVLDALGQRWVHDLGADDYALDGYFGSKRWHYYRLRAEGQNTLVINPGAAADQTVGALTSIVRDEATAAGSISVADLTAAYAGMARVWRGVALNSRDGSVLVQDELQSAAPADVWWFAHLKLDASQVQIAADGRSAILVSGSNRLWVKLVGPSGGRLELLDPTPLATSPQPTGQNPNVGYKKLAIHLQNVTSRALAVWFVPLSPGEEPPLEEPTLVPLGDWAAPAESEHWLGDVDGYLHGAADDAMADAAWQRDVAAATGLATAGFDTVADDRAVPMTFRYVVPAGQQVVRGRLSLGVRSTGGDTTNDRLYLDGTASGSFYAALGWAPLTTTATARTVDLWDKLSLLQDGHLNVAVRDNTAVDWASLELEYGPTGQFTGMTLAAQVDATVRDGAAAGQNFGTGDLVVERGTAGSNQEAFLRFDLTGVTGTVAAAVLRLSPLAASGAGEQQLALVADNGWSESGITWNTKPASGTVLATWTARAGAAVEIDLRAVVGAVLLGDKRLSLRVYPTAAGAGLASYGSRDNAVADWRPQLLLSLHEASVGDSLVVEGDSVAAGQSDDIRLVGEAGYVNVFVNGAERPLLRRDLATLTSIDVRGHGGDDTLVVDFSGGNAAPPGGIHFDGGAGVDTLRLVGGGQATARAGHVAYGETIVSHESAECFAMWTAGVTISGTTLRIGADNALGAATAVTISGGVLDLGGHTTAAGAVTLVEGSIVDGTLAGASYTLQSGTVSAALGGSGNLLKNTRGKVVLSGDNSYTGKTTIYEGILNIRGGRALGQGNAAVVISCDGATYRFSALEFEGPDFAVEGKPLSTTGAGYGGLNANGVAFSAGGALRNIIGNHVWSGPVTLTGGGGGSSYQSDAGLLTIAGDVAPNTNSRNLTLQGAGRGAILGSISDGGQTTGLWLSKTGTGTWTLAGNNTFTGATTVAAGTLLIDGGHASPTVRVNNGAVLGGTGTLAGTITVNGGGRLSPAGSGGSGTLRSEGVVLSANSQLDFDLASPPSADVVAAVGTLTIGGGRVNIVAAAGLGPGIYPLLTYGGLAGAASNLTLGNVPAGYGYRLMHNDAARSIDLVVDAAPRVAGIYARGSGWNGGYLATIEAAGQGTAAAGFRLADGGGQLSHAAALTWQNVNQLSIVFSEAVSLPAGSLRLLDSAGDAVALAAEGFRYDAARHTATWTFEKNLGRNKYLIALEAAAVVDGAGLALDGEWTTGTTTYATSGNGAAGGNLYFRFNVLPGDVSLNGQTNTGDVGLLRSLGTLVPTAQNYRCDVTGNNQINSGDLGFVRSLGTLSLAGLPEPKNPPAGMSLLAGEDSGAVLVAADTAMVAADTAMVAAAADWAASRASAGVAGFVDAAACVPALDDYSDSSLGKRRNPRLAG